MNKRFVPLRLALIYTLLTGLLLISTFVVKGYMEDDERDIQNNDKESVGYLEERFLVSEISTRGDTLF